MCRASLRLKNECSLHQIIPDTPEEKHVVWCMTMSGSLNAVNTSQPLGCDGERQPDRNQDTNRDMPVIDSMAGPAMSRVASRRLQLNEVAAQTCTCTPVAKLGLYWPWYL